MILRYNPQLLLPVPDSDRGADPLAIPAFLKIPKAQRAQAWVRNQPRNPAALRFEHRAR